MPKEENPPIELKLVLVGANRSGKTALVEKYLYNRDLLDYRPTMGLDFKKHETVDEQQRVLKIVFWEIAWYGRRSSRGLAQNYISTAHAVMAVLDLRDRSQLEAIKDYRQLVAQYGSDAHFIIVGIRPRGVYGTAVKEKELKDKARDWNCTAICLDLNDKKKIDALFLRMQTIMVEKEMLRREVLEKKAKERQREHEELEKLEEEVEQKQEITQKQEAVQKQEIPQKQEAVQKQATPIQQTNLQPEPVKVPQTTEKPKPRSWFLGMFVSSIVCSGISVSLISAFKAWNPIINYCASLFKISMGAATILAPSLIIIGSIALATGIYMTARKALNALKRHPEENTGNDKAKKNDTVNILQKLGPAEKTLEKEMQPVKNTDNNVKQATEEVAPQRMAVKVLRM